MNYKYLNNPNIYKGKSNNKEKQNIKISWSQVMTQTKNIKSIKTNTIR